MKDNYSTEENITVIKSICNPNGVVKVLTGETNAIVCQYEGVYEFRIIVMDEAGNSKLYRKKITVIK